MQSENWKEQATWLRSGDESETNFRTTPRQQTGT